METSCFWLFLYVWIILLSFSSEANTKSKATVPDDMHTRLYAYTWKNQKKEICKFKKQIWWNLNLTDVNFNWSEIRRLQRNVTWDMESMINCTHTYTGSHTHTHNDKQSYIHIIKIKRLLHIHYRILRDEIYQCYVACRFQYLKISVIHIFASRNNHLKRIHTLFKNFVC